MRTPDEVTRAAQAQVPSGDYVPMATHVSPTVIKLKRGEYMATWRLAGIPFETIDRDVIGIRKEGLNNFLRGLAGGRFAVWSHKVRRVVKPRLRGEYGNAFCRDLSERYNRSLESERQIATELYLTVIYRPTPSKVGRLFKRLSARSAQDIMAREREDLDALDDAAKQVEASLARYEPERLGSYVKQDVVCSEVLAFLGFLLNGVWEHVPMRRANLGDYLPTSRLHFGDKNGMLEIWHATARKYVGFLDFQEYPQFSEPGMNNAILYGDYEYIETQSFSLKNKREALDGLDRQKGQLSAGEDVATREIAEIEQAKEDVQGGLIEMGEYHYTLAVFGNSASSVARHMADARQKLSDGPGFKMAAVDAIPECAWFAQLPGNWWLRPREASITSRNFASLSPLHNFASGKKDGNPWGEALALMRTPNGQPFYLNLHVSPDDKDSTDEKYPGNTFICGATGSGKTVLEMSLLAFATKYAGMRCVFFDKDRGAELGIRQMGGKYFTLARGEPTGLQPLQLPPTESNIEHCERLVHILVGASQPDRAAAEDSEISAAVRTVMSDRVAFELRSLSAVWQALKVTPGGNGLRDRLRKWTRGQPLGWVFDNPKDLQDFSNASIFGYDYTEFLDDPEIRTPIMAYLLHITKSLIDGRPFMYVMEEFWKPLQDPVFSDFARDQQKTIRKKLGLGVFVTQSPSDVLTHSIGKTMVEQSVTQIFLPNPRADHDDYVNGFKVTEAEFKIIRSLGETSRMFLVKQGHRSAVVRFDLGGMPDILDVISGAEDNVRLFDELRPIYGDDPVKWLPAFHERIAARRANERRASNAAQA